MQELWVVRRGVVVYMGVGYWVGALWGIMGWGGTVYTSVLCFVLCE